MPFQEKTLLTFAQLKDAFQPFGLAVEKTRIDSHSSAVEIVYDGVPYTIDYYHQLDSEGQAHPASRSART